MIGWDAGNEFGVRSAVVKALAQRLFKSAQAFATSALAAYDRGESHVFLLHGATSLEHLLKARLAELNPVLISKRDHVPSLVWFADESRHELDNIDVRTITLDEALGLVAALRVPLGPHRDDISQLQKHRNGVAHLGVSDSKVAQQTLPSLLLSLTILSQDLGATREEFFGDYDEFVLTQLAVHREEEEREYTGRVAQARMRLAAEHGDLGPSAIGHLRRLAELRWHRLSLQDQLVDCPVCQLPAYAEGELWQVDWDVDYDEHANIGHAFPVLEYHPDTLRCPTCGLFLDSASLIQLSGAFENWQLSQKDYDVYVRELAEAHRDWGDG
jgi:hypothetical protein